MTTPTQSTPTPGAREGAGDPTTEAAERAATQRETADTWSQASADLDADRGEQWTTEELKRDFEVLAFSAPFVLVRRRSDGATGSLEFTHRPRLYFNWTPDEREASAHEREHHASTLPHGSTPVHRGAW